MFAIITRIRPLFVLLALAVVASPAAATSPPVATHRDSTEPTKHEVAMEHTQTGSPELGILLIIGIVGFVIFVAWLFSRMGDDSATGSDVAA